MSMTVNWEFWKVFLATMVLVLLLRFFEMSVSKNNEKKLLEAKLGTIIKPHEHYIVYLFHMLWFLSLILESIFVQKIQQSMVALLCYGVLAFAQIIRFESMQTLGIFWTTKIYRISKDHIKSDGLFRYFAHPSYLAVILEFIVLPLLFHAYYTLIIFSLINLFILAHRIKLESQVTGRML
jgi:methyltransferase